ncbi:DUF2971 domain-containing protein [Mesorhizobium sp. M3A.F.Ca.ET.201.01.1.1]|uniref:DUF2971 domain-containing protein n=1 Tax=Mesorhizobium sp. M3A.F.Ca.ET.201.01.1.1 TaxID=2563946 RepID=UPI001094143B|nr:DUF2971 domain-containing protein [Mesorhizobium sp. M3A.F.Ca.ET.201.01.1.1]TGS64057.1 DUF2971 domain-containing protein [Mesorhizobium sp. M3A.F.Ca.ET.201.01.1.1]
MKYKNIINLSDKDLDIYVYRVMPLKRLYELFSTKQNVLVRPSKWEDPFENFILNAHARLPDGTIVTFGFNNDFYGQCWTKLTSSDALWRIYSPDKTSVRVRTTVRKLLTTLQAPLGEWAHEQAFVGQVLYLGDKKLVAFGNEVFRDGLNSRALAETLLVKRVAFRHEREVRLLYFEKDKAQKDIYAYPVDPHALIDQVMLDPRLLRAEADAKTGEIRKRTGFKGKILHSLLYAPPKGMIFPIGL